MAAVTPSRTDDWQQKRQSTPQLTAIAGQSGKPEPPRESLKQKLQRYLRQIEYSGVVSGYYLFLTFTTLHLPWMLDLHVHGINRNDKFENETEVRLYERRANNTNIHGLLMTIGMFFLPGSVILMYRVCCCYRRKVVTRFHAFVSTLSLPFMIAGMVAGDSFYSYDGGKYVKRMSTFHSWMGGLTILLTIIQLFLGFLIYNWLQDEYLWQRAQLRANYTPYHFYVGLTSFTCAALCIVTAETQILTFSYPGEDFKEGFLYRRFVSVARHLRVGQLLVTITLGLVYYSLIREDFRFRGRIVVAKDKDPLPFSRRAFPP